MTGPRRKLTFASVPRCRGRAPLLSGLRLGTIAVLLLSLILSAHPLLAVEPDEVLEDPVLEGRARELSKEIRCLVCQNESIDSSNAQLAKDLRIIVRERLVAGDSDQEVYDYLVARYGDYVLLRPPMRPETYFLWFGPAVVFLLGAGGVAFYFMRLRRRAASDAPAPLSAQEERQLAQLLGDTQHSENSSGAAPDQPGGGKDV